MIFNMELSGALIFLKLLINCKQMLVNLKKVWMFCTDICSKIRSFFDQNNNFLCKYKGSSFFVNGKHIIWVNMTFFMNVNKDIVWIDNNKYVKIFILDFVHIALKTC